MHMKKLHALEESLACLLEEQMTCLENVDAQEMGEVVDMIKDIEEAKYYCAVVKAMEESSYSDYGKMYYHEPYTQKEIALSDGKEGKSHKTRKMYMEAKASHQEKSVQMRELEKYMQELASDILEMVEDASSEEKLYLSKKISALATKVQNLNND